MQGRSDLGIAGGDGVGLLIRHGEVVKKSPTKRNNLLFVVNYTPVDRPDYRVGVPKKKQYKLIMDENGLLDKPKIFKAEEQECDHREYSFNYSLPGYGVAVFTY